MRTWPGGTRPKWRGQEAGGRREEGPSVLAYCVCARLSKIEKPYLPYKYLEQKGAPPLPRLTGRSSAGKKVRQGQARRRASSVNQSSVNFGGKPRSVSVNPSVCLPVCPSICGASGCDYTKFGQPPSLPSRTSNRRINEIRARSISILGNSK